MFTITIKQLDHIRSLFTNLKQYIAIGASTQLFLIARGQKMALKTCGHTVLLHKALSATSFGLY